MVSDRRSRRRRLAAASVSRQSCWDWGRSKAKTNRREYQSDLGVLCKKGKKLREMTKKIGFYRIYAPARDSLGRAKSRWAVSWPVLEIFVVWV